MVLPSNKIKSANGSPLPEFINGIDIKVGVRHLAGNQELYRALLKDFVQEFTHVVEEIRNCLFHDLKEDIPTAKRLLQSIRVISGNMAAKDLHLAASNLEKAVVENRFDHWLDMMEAFTVAFNVVMSSISTLDKAGLSEVADESPHEEATSDEIEHELNYLAILIKKKHFQAKKQLITLKAKLGREASSETMGLLESCLNKNDFRGALKYLHPLADLLNITLKYEKK
ncbi:MAG: hypothetical protein HQL68_03065 [Magnetococcales bacterium]|nr:hypothetical protein [Magnetococcales bacterium]